MYVQEQHDKRDQVQGDRRERIGQQPRLELVEQRPDVGPHCIPQGKGGHVGSKQGCPGIRDEFIEDGDGADQAELKAEEEEEQAEQGQRQARAGEAAEGGWGASSTGNSGRTITCGDSNGAGSGARRENRLANGKEVLKGEPADIGLSGHDGHGGQLARAGGDVRQLVLLPQRGL